LPANCLFPRLTIESAVARVPFIQAGSVPGFGTLGHPARSL
jgi:hypothetical protein